MSEVSIIGVDLAKRVFQVHGALPSGDVAFRKKLSRSQFMKFLSEQPPCLIAMEACATAHYWGREALEAGHEVRLIPPIYVKPWSCHAYVPVSELIYAAFRSNAKGLLPPSDEWRRRGL